MKCPNCHKEYLPGDLFCENCGTRLSGIEDVSAKTESEPEDSNHSLNNQQEKPAVSKVQSMGDFDKQPDIHICPSCKKPVEADDLYCLYCGTKLHPDENLEESGIQNPSSNENPYSDLKNPDYTAFPDSEKAGSAYYNSEPPKISNLHQQSNPVSAHQDANRNQKTVYQNQADYIENTASGNWNVNGSDVHADRKKEKSSKKILWIVLAAAAILLCGAGGYMAWSYFQKPESSRTVLEENRNYIVLSPMKTASDAFGEENQERIETGTVLYILESTSDETLEEWGKIDENNWIKMSDGEYTYLLPEDTLQMDDTQRTPAEEMYEVIEDVRVYSVPASVSIPLSSLSAGQDIYVYEFIDKGAETWARTGVDQWVCIKDAAGVYLEPEKQDESASSSQSSSSSADSSKNNSSKSSQSSSSSADSSKNSSSSNNQSSSSADSSKNSSSSNSQSSSSSADSSKNSSSSSSQSSSSSTDTKESSSSSSSDEKKDSDTISADSDTGGIRGYRAGNYTLNYRMKTRKGPSYTAEQITVIPADETVYIADFEEVSEKNSIWGELDYKGSGTWMCIEDDDYVYLSQSKS